VVVLEDQLGVGQRDVELLCKIVQILEFGFGLDFAVEAQDGHVELVPLGFVEKVLVCPLETQQVRQRQ